MEQIEPPVGTQDRASLLRRTLVAVGIVLAALVLIGVAVYAGAFLMLAPMMQ